MQISSSRSLSTVLRGNNFVARDGSNFVAGFVATFLKYEVDEN